MTDELPDRVTLRSNPLETALLLIAVAAVSYLIISRIPPEDQGARTVVLVVSFLIAAFAAATSLRQLKVDRDGFSEGNLFGCVRHAWRDCSPFEVSTGGGRVQVNSIRATTSAGEIRLRTRYGRSLDEIAALMNRFRARALDASREKRA